MASATLIPVEEYLTTSYDPDCDYVDGVLVERNVGEQDHGNVQGALYAWFRARRRELGIQVYIEQRVQVGRTRFRVPDVCVRLGMPVRDQILSEPPFLCIEVLSREDRMSRMQQRIDDYLNFGVRFVWVVDPETRKGYVYSSDGMHEAKDGILRTENPALAVSLPEIFQEIENS